MRDKKLSIITTLSNPDTAFANRLKCIAKGFRGNNISVEILGLMSNKYCEDSFVQDGISFKNLLAGKTSKIMRFLCGILEAVRICKDCDMVMVELANPLLLFPFVLLKNKNQIFLHERTEFPELSERGWKLRLYLLLCRRFDKILVISTNLRAYFIDRGIDKDRVIIYPMLIDPDRFRENCNKKVFDYRYMAYCGDMGSNKDGLYNLIDAYSIFHKSNNDVKMLLIGDAQNKFLYEKLKNYVETLGLGSDIVFTGRVHANEVPEYLNGADVLLLARPDNIQARYGFPTKLGEYLATGKPVIVTDTGDIAKYLVSGVDCYIVKPDDTGEFSAMMVKVCNDYSAAVEVGENGKRKIYKEFNCIVQTRELLKKIGA